MFDSGFIGVAIGLILVYFLLSLLVSGANEILEAFWQRRARYLEVGIWDLLGPLTSRFYKHGAIAALAPHKGRPPRVEGVRDDSAWTQSSRTVLGDAAAASSVSESGGAEPRAARSLSYIPARAFSRATLDIVLQMASEHRGVATEGGAKATPGATATPDADALFRELETAIARAPLPAPLKGTLEAFLKNANRDVDRFRTQVEQWFDDKMARVSGWYKRRTKAIVFVLGLLVVSALNADTVSFASTLWSNGTLRDSITAQAQSFSADSPVCRNNPDTRDNPAACEALLLGDVKGLRMPLGWSSKSSGFPHGPVGILWKVLGLLVTAFALTLGAPFWFDLLNKFVNFRASGAPPPTTQASTPVPAPAPSAGAAPA
jgi:hypothetical protein